MNSRHVAIVTGASRGIGRAIGIELAKSGHDIVLNYASNAAAAQEAGDTMQAAGAKVHPVQADISIAADRQKLVDEAVKTFGRIDMLVNNAGVAPNVRADILEASEESFDRVIGINLKGPYFLTQLVARKMIELKSKGQIITISSVSAYAASTNRGDYCIAKAGLGMMTQLFASRLAEHGINVYEIRPGIIETDMTAGVKSKYDDMIFNKDLTPIKRWGKPQDVAQAVLAIAEGRFSFSTGLIIDVDGGYHIRRL